MILSASHVWPETGSNFNVVRAGMAIARLVHGLLEFSAFVASSFFGGPNASAQFVVLILSVPLVLYLLRRAWTSNEEAPFYLSLAIAGNLMFGLVTVWAGSLPVEKTAECSVDQSGRQLQVVEYSERGWLPEYHYFLAAVGEAPGEWEHVAKRTHPESIQDPCGQISTVFPDLEQLLDVSLQPTESLFMTRTTGR